MKKARFIKVCMIIVCSQMWFIFPHMSHSKEEKVTYPDFGKIKGDTDFGKKKVEEAKKWAEEHFQDWHKDLDKEQKALLQNDPRVEAINKELEQWRKIEYIEDESIKIDVKKIDKSLKSSHAKQDHKRYVYKHLTHEELGYAGDSFYKEGSKEIDREQYDQFKNDFQYGMIHDFMKLNLTQHPGDKSHPVLLRLEIPKGNSMGYLKEDEVFIQRNTGIEITGSSIITVKGREVIKVEAKLVSRDQVLQKITSAENRINKQFQEVTGLENKLVSFNGVNGLYASNVVKRSETILDQLFSNVPNVSLDQSVAEMSEDGAIYFVDTDISERIGEDGEHVTGAYVRDEGFLWIKMNHPGHISKKGEDLLTLTHEFGHVIDDLLFDDISMSKQFKTIYAEEKDSITIEPYIKKNSQEFFAGVFSYLYSPIPKEREQIQKEAPKASRFIKEKMESVIY